MYWNWIKNKVRMCTTENVYQIWFSFLLYLYFYNYQMKSMLEMLKDLSIKKILTSSATLCMKYNVIEDAVKILFYLWLITDVRNQLYSNSNNFSTFYYWENFFFFIEKSFTNIEEWRNIIHKKKINKIK